MTDYHAGQLLQMQIIEELNNNWESRFPEKENIWTFAVLNLEPVARELNGMKVKSVPLPNRYFDMRQWPLECQSKATQALIKASGPIIQEKPKILEPAKPVPSRAAKEAEALGKVCWLIVPNFTSRAPKTSLQSSNALSCLALSQANITTANEMGPTHPWFTTKLPIRRDAIPGRIPKF